MATNNALNNQSAPFTVTAGDLILSAGNFLMPDTVVGGTAGKITVGGNLYFNNFGSGGSNTFWGFNSGNINVLNTGGGNNGFGAGTLQFMQSGSQNTAMGHVALQVVTTGSNNSAIGGGAGNLVTTGGNNTLIGYQSGAFVQTGSSNIALGYQAGNSWTAANANNINIGNVGANESATIRIGTNATHTAAYIAGIDGVNVGSVAKVLTMASDKLGTATITAGTGITVTPGANTITISSSGTTSLTYTNVNTTPYVVLATDEYLSVDCSGGPITLQFPNAATLGRVFIVKDRTGSANSNAITITTVGGAVNIDGATSYSMNTQYAAIQLMGNGSTYEIF